MRRVNPFYRAAREHSMGNKAENVRTAAVRARDHNIRGAFVLKGAEPLCPEKIIIVLNARVSYARLWVILTPYIHT